MCSIGLTATAHFELPHSRISRTAVLDIARRGDDQAFQPVRELPAEIGHVAVVGADHPGFERGVGQPDEAHPRAGDQEMDVCPFVVHVLDAVRGLIVLHPRPRHLAAAPLQLAAGEGLARLRLAQHPPVVFGGDAIVVETVARPPPEPATYCANSASRGRNPGST